MGGLVFGALMALAHLHPFSILFSLCVFKGHSHLRSAAGLGRCSPPVVPFGWPFLVSCPIGSSNGHGLSC